MRDGLTDANNRRFLLEFLAQHPEHRALLLLDIDRFMQLNDLHGYRACDAVLRELAALLREQVKVGECFARYGGDVFAYVVPGANVVHALHLAEALRQLVEQHRFTFDLTVSIGVSTQDLDDAEAKLRTAKKTGRNRVVG